MTFKIFGLAAVAAVGLGCGQAMAADLLVDAPMAVEAPSASSGFWDGFYIGVFGGRGAGTITEVTSGGFGFSDDDFEVAGWLLGVKAGADMYLADHIVAGVVGDIAWTDMSGGSYGVSFYRVDYDVNWVGSLRGRIGYDMGSILPYLTAGVAVLNGTGYSDNTILSLGIADPTKLHVGWTAGVGVALAVSDNMSVDLEYRYSDYGEATYEDFRNGSIDTPLALTAHQITVGLNWSF